MEKETDRQIINLIVHPGKWVSEKQLIALKGLTSGMLKNARKLSFMEGREYKHVSAGGEPFDNSQCFYNIDAIDLWIERQSKARPSRRK
ncbi:TPA: excisionase family protein [Klebsiella michiganensis]